jgi:PAS domain S-box-containing protein
VNQLPTNEVLATYPQLSSALFEHHPLACLVVDPTSLQIVEANKAALVFYGYGARELKSLTFTQLFHPASQLTWQQPLQGGQGTNGRHLALQLKKGGREVIVELFLSTLEIEAASLWQVAVIDVSESNSVQQNLLAEKERYKVYIEQCTEGIFCQQFPEPVPLDLPMEQLREHLKKGCYISECNPALVRMYGYEQPADLIGVHPCQLLDLSDEVNKAFIEAFITNGFRLFDAESHERDRAGNEKYFLNNLIGIIENDCLVCIWGTQRDITEKKQAEQRIKLLANLVEQTTDVLVAADLDFRPISWNKAAERIYGLTPQQAIGHTISDLIDIVYQNTAREEVRAIVNRRGEWRGEMYFTRPTDGRKVTLLGSFKLLKDENDKPLGFLVAGTDITERKETEMKLKESENRFRYIADTAPVMIWICNDLNKTTYTSKHWINFTGVDIVSDPSIGWSSVVHPEDVAEAARVFDESFEQKHPVLITYRIRTKDGTYRWVQDVGIPLYLEDGTFIGYIGCIVDIHDTKSKEEQLRQHALILEQVNDIIIITDPDIRVKTLNKAAERYMGVTENEAAGRKLGEFVQLKVCNSNETEAWAELDSAGIWQGEVSFVGGSGETRYLLQTVSYTSDEQGNRNGIMSVGRDITDRKLADEKLKQSEKFYRSLIADSLDGMLLLNPNGDITFVSPSIRHILGYQPEEVAGRNAFEFVHPDDATWAWDAFQREVAENPEVKYIIIRLQKKNGEWLWCSVRGHNLLSNPYVNSLAIYFHDETLRKKASDDLKQSEKRFRTLIQDLQIGISLFNARGELVMCNATYSGLLNSSEEAMLGKRVLELFPEAYREDGTPFKAEERPLYLALHTKRPVRDAVMGLDLGASGERTWLLINIDLVLDENGQIVQVINSAIDITERKKLEQRLIDEQINKQKQLTQASIDGQEKERKEIGKELHDNIGQQLTTTKLFLDMAKSSADDTTNEMISMALKGISDVINEIRSMSRSLMPPTLGDLGLMESIGDLVETISRTQYLHIDLDDYEFDELRVPDNKKVMLFRIIQEQLNNIVKHAEARRVSVMLRNDKPFLLLEIKDDGKGFDPKVVKKGLGLTNMRNRAELFGGEVKIVSSEGKGCTLTVKVPQSLEKIAF